jgi:small GTP-binding protein
MGGSCMKSADNKDSANEKDNVPAVENAEQRSKMILVGEFGVGKTTLLLRLAEDVYYETFDSDEQVRKQKTYSVCNKSVICDFLDTAGQEKFRTLTSTFYRKTQMILLCFDLCQPSTLSELNSHFRDAKRYTELHESFFLIVGLKADQIDKRSVPTASVEALAKKLNVTFLEVSAKTRAGVEEVHAWIAQALARPSSSALSRLPSAGDSPQVAKSRTSQTRL